MLILASCSDVFDVYDRQDKVGIGVGVYLVGSEWACILDWSGRD